MSQLRRTGWLIQLDRRFRSETRSEHFYPDLRWSQSNWAKRQVIVHRVDLNPRPVVFIITLDRVPLKHGAELWYPQHPMALKGFGSTDFLESLWDAEIAEAESQSVKNTPFVKLTKVVKKEMPHVCP
ncbi:hypothetical protein J7363_17305 [Phaeobacter italicus]|uniref:hypothetical protein n=1 Tax=Phaeobacter italicus TaxID=481446 RepID=UPI001ADA5E3F|nr:hypothetical protein [Phaeobacter italicus]MBO9443856.1 hypothetical protein [Phaeobacter italicus]